MSSVYGFAQSLSEGSSFNARTLAHNDLVNEHNNKILADYDTAKKQQTRDAATDSTQVEEDAAIQGTEDGKGLIGVGVGAYGLGQDIAEAGGIGAGLAKQTAERQGAIASTFERLTQGESLATNPGVRLGATGIGAATGATGAADAARAAGQLAGGAEEIGSSGVGSAIIKAGLKMGGAGKVLSEAGLTTVSEVAGKAAGDFGGAVDLGEGLINLGEGKNFFGNDDAAEKVGDTFQMAGAAMDVVGTAFPPLELLGGAAGLLGGVIDGIDSIGKDEAKKQSDAAPIVDPNKNPAKAGIVDTKVSPAFQSLGLVASAPISAKMSITGSSGAF
jgi:hypothetical protein